MRWLYVVCLLLSVFLELYVAPALPHFKSKEDASKQAQEPDNIRYIISLVEALRHDPEFVRMSEKTDLAKDGLGFLTNGMVPKLGSDAKAKLNKLKKDEIERRAKLLAKHKDHPTAGKSIHHDDKGDFSQEDFTKLLSKYKDIQDLMDAKRRHDFKEYEIRKELRHRKIMENGTEQEKAEEAKHYKAHNAKKHDPMHEPMHKAQLEEVWEQEDGLDPEAFDTKTLFNLHDKDADGLLDKFELETFFLHDLDKAYNLSDPDTDPKERQEDMERMREDALKWDTDNDTKISYDEFHAGTEGTDFEKDEEYTPLTDEEQYSEDDVDEYSSEHENDNYEDDEGHEEDDEHHADAPADGEHHDEDDAPADGEHHDTKDSPKKGRDGSL